MRLTRTVTTTAALPAVFAYLSDFTSTTDWDPGTVVTTRISGDGGVGSVYANTSKFNGRTTELQYTVIAFEPNQLVRLRGENKSVTAVDTISFQQLPDGRTQVTYDADFQFKGVARIAVPFLGGAFRRLGDEAEHGLQRALSALEGGSHA